MRKIENLKNNCVLLMRGVSLGILVPLHGNFELRPLGATMGNASSVTRA